MNRFQFALAAAASQSASTLPNLARALATAIDAIEAEGGTPEDDPAVLVMGSLIAFHTHADINTLSGYRNLLSLCEHQLATSAHTND
jgi:hypothetical protein